MGATALAAVHWPMPVAAGPPAPSALPAAGAFTAGGGAIAQSGSSLTVSQTTPRAVIDWKSFFIGANAHVAISNGTGATLNRVTGSQASQIAGGLTATGSAYLLNPNGVLVLPGGKVVTGGNFVAGTGGISNDAFMSGRAMTLSGTSQAGVDNQGVIVSRKGGVLLIAGEVANSGSIAAAGLAGLTAARRVTLTETASGGAVRVEIPGGNVTNTGAIQAAQVRLTAAGGNIYAPAGNDGGLIQATGTSTPPRVGISTRPPATMEV